MRGFTNTITVESPSGVDDYGKPSYGSSKTIQCRIQRSSGKVLSQGVYVDATHVIYALEEVTLEDRITLDGETYKAKSSSYHETPDGSNSFYKVVL